MSNFTFHPDRQYHWFHEKWQNFKHMTSHHVFFTPPSKDTFVVSISLLYWNFAAVNMRWSYLSNFSFISFGCLLRSGVTLHETIYTVPYDGCINFHFHQQHIWILFFCTGSPLGFTLVPNFWWAMQWLFHSIPVLSAFFIEIYLHIHLEVSII